VVPRRDAPTVPGVIERFVKALVVTAKAVSLYPPSSNIPLDAAKECAAVLSDALGERSELHLLVTKDGLFYFDLPVFPDNPAYAAFAFELYNRKLADVRFHSGVEPQDLVSFCAVLSTDPADLEFAGGYGSRLWELGVGTITVTDAHMAVVEGAVVEGAEEPAPTLSRLDFDEALSAAYGGRTRDQVTIGRVMRDPKAVGDYLAETFEAAGVSGLIEAGERFSELAAVACKASDAEKFEMLHSLGEALRELDPALTRSLLTEELLPDSRADESVASVIRQMSIDEVCQMLVSGTEETEVSKEGLARAIRTLALISMADKREVATAAGAAMTGAGFSEGMVSEVLEMTAPSRLTVRERGSALTQQDKPADTIFRLMDMAPTPGSAIEQLHEPEVEALRQEAARGITDGDVIMALVSLVLLDAREAQFASVCAMLEDSLEVLVERGDLIIAADVCDALNAAAQNTELSQPQRLRLKKAIGRFTKPTDIRAMANALRIYKPESPEHVAAKRLLDGLGGQAIDPLLEQLAEESDMAVRKSLIDVLSGIAPFYIEELSSHLADSRWYVARNVIQVLGSTKSSAVLPFLERTLRHPEPRVRREAIRALSGINDPRSIDMLRVGLNDTEGQNVQLAARYLGVANVQQAIPDLEQVARGEGRGNRDIGPRVEAIEALGKLRATKALPTLESLAGKRAIISAGKTKEIRAAAEAAISRIKSGGGAR
jgi:HEAT repeat protein